ncbi:hypothetical protein ACJX0J_013249, partial [Zea mays]
HPMATALVEYAQPKAFRVVIKSLKLAYFTEIYEMKVQVLQDGLTFTLHEQENSTYLAKK